MPSSFPNEAVERMSLDGFALCGVPELLEFAAPYVPAGLIDADAWAVLNAIPPVLPPAISIAAFECHLGAGVPRVDFEACIRVAGGGRARLAAGLDVLERTAPSDVHWWRTLGFLRAWTTPGSRLNEGVPVVWLEFDLDASTGATPAPFLVFTLDPRRQPGAGGPDAAAEVLHDGLAVLGGGAIDPVASGTLARALRELPPTGRLLHVAMRPGAGPGAIRVVLKLPWRSLPAYLDRLGWAGSPAGLTEWIAASAPTTVAHSINLDLGASVEPRVGIEYHFPTAPEQDARWGRLFDCLAAAEACTEERRAQLYTWRSPGAPATGLLRIDRDLLIKVVYETGAPLRAKAYLPFGARLNLT